MTQQNQPSRTDPAAITSLVFGVLWIFGFGSLIALILGIQSLNSISEDPTLGGKSLAIIGAVLGATGLFFTWILPFAIAFGAV